MKQTPFSLPFPSSLFEQGKMSTESNPSASRDLQQKLFRLKIWDVEAEATRSTPSSSSETPFPSWYQRNNHGTQISVANRIIPTIPLSFHALGEGEGKSYEKHGNAGVSSDGYPLASQKAI